MKYEIRQTNHFTYEGSVSHSINQFRLKPIEDHEQKCLSFDVTIDPEATCYIHNDYWGNHVETFYIWESHDKLMIETHSVVEVCKKQIPPSPSFNEEMLQMFDSDAFKQEYAEFLVQTDYTTIDQAKIEAVTDKIWEQSKDPHDFVNRVNTYLYETFTYVPGATTVETKAEEVLNNEEGVCQDYTHVMLALCRHRGIPARYVSGYIYVDENSAMRGDAATHAWVEIALPNIGWVGFDPTNNVIAKDQHIRLAVGRDYQDIVPVKGIYIGGKQHLQVGVSVKKIDPPNESGSSQDLYFVRKNKELP
ncbi:MAG TPA: transglutaminase family protein [Bacillales bacterium]|nr:transglutaminase family protein [Bacillales bacterium]